MPLFASTTRVTVRIVHDKLINDVNGKLRDYRIVCSARVLLFVLFHMAFARAAARLPVIVASFGGVGPME